MLSRTRWYKNCHNIFSVQFFNSKLGRMLCNSYSNRFCDFYIFPIVGIGAVNFQRKKNRQSTLVFRCFSLQKKWKNFFISIFINYTIWLTFVWRICVSIVQGFPPRAFLKQRLAHSSASAKTIPAFSHQAAATNIRWTWGKLVKGQRDSAEQAKGLEECLWRSGH